MFGPKMPSAALTKLNPAVCSGFRRVCNSTSFFGRGKLLLGKSRSSEVLPYSIRLLSETSGFNLSGPCGRSSMAASGTKAVFGDVYIDDLVSCSSNGLDLAKPSNVYFNDRRQNRCQIATMSLRKQESPSNKLLCGYYVFDSVRKNWNSNFLVGAWLKNIHTSSSVCFSTGAAHDVSFDGGSHDEQLASSSIASDQYVLSS